MDPKFVVALSLEGAKDLVNDTSLSLTDVYSCNKCMDISQGWEVAAWRQREPEISMGPFRVVTTPTHFLIESKIDR
jgi:cytochrome c peroxidase